MKKVFIKNLNGKFLSFLKRVFSFLPFFIMLILIFCFSGQNGNTSGSLSGSVSSKIIHFVNSITFRDWSASVMSSYAENIEFLVRKISHISEYLILTLSFIIPFSRTFISRKFLFPISITTCILAASLDEFHQTFVIGRTGCIRDVFIDSIGIIIASGLFYLVFRFQSRTIFSK